MVRRYRRGRRAAGRRRYGVLRKRRFVPGGRPRTALAKKTHWFKEMYQSTSLVGSAAATTGGIMNFSLNELQNAGSFKSMFDLYKIKGVKIKIIPRFNNSEATNLNVNSQMGTLPVLYIAPNRDPYVPAPTGLGDILNDDGCRVIRLTRPVNMYLSSPKPKITAFSSGTEIADVPLMFNVGSKWQPWLTTGGNSQTIDQSGILHYGFRYAINNEAPADCVLDVYATLYFCCKEQD